jgi:hypothetical protein
VNRPVSQPRKRLNSALRGPLRVARSKAGGFLKTRPYEDRIEVVQAPAPSIVQLVRNGVIWVGFVCISKKLIFLLDLFVGIMYIRIS